MHMLFDLRSMAVRVAAVVVAAMTLVTTAYAQKHGLNVSAGSLENPSNVSTLVAQTANTGVQWVIIYVYWSWAEPFESTDGADWTAWGPQVQRLHGYRTASLDLEVQGFQSRGINVVLQILSHPEWASGGPCKPTGAGGTTNCGIIMQANFSKYRDNMYDFAYNLAARYPAVRYWSIGNEPNTDKFFSPQPPLLYGSPAAQFMDLIGIPSTNAIHAVNPSATIVGPNLYTCANSGSSCSNLDHNWGYTTNWNTDWANLLLINYPSYFPTWTIHNYSSDDWGDRTAVGVLWNTMVADSQQRTIWTTEFNFNSGTCGNTEREIADWTCKNYKYMTWERAFFFDIDVGGGCFSLLNSGGVPKSFLYPAFTSIVSNVYVCQ